MLKLGNRRRESQELERHFDVIDEMRMPCGEFRHAGPVRKADPGRPGIAIERFHRLPAPSGAEPQQSRFIARHCASARRTPRVRRRGFSAKPEHRGDENAARPARPARAAGRQS
ncbi:hypothetical protein AAFM48_26860 [Burkholderia pseudomallei]